MTRLVRAGTEGSTDDADKSAGQATQAAAAGEAGLGSVEEVGAGQYVCGLVETAQPLFCAGLQLSWRGDRGRSGGAEIFAVGEGWHARDHDSPIT